MAAYLAISVGGCQSAHQGHGRPATQTDRLMQAYDDLRGGRFVVIADFENPLHMELFQLVSVSEQARCVLDKRGGSGDVTGVWLAFADIFQWVAGVAGNHDTFGPDRIRRVRSG